MTREEKQLLLIDLCTRLPHGVIVHATIDGDNTLLGVYNDRVLTTCEEHGKHNDYPLDCIKPYLRTMESMTNEERNELASIQEKNLPYPSVKYRGCDYLNSIHVDYRGLIPMGLALEAKEGMYKV